MYCRTGQQCTVVNYDSGDGEAWMMIDLGSAQTVRTILFFADEEGIYNNEGHASLTRSYGTSADRTDTSTNTVIAQSGGTNYPGMIADLDGAPQVRYIHIRGTSVFRMLEVMCYELSRVTKEEY